MVTRGWHLSYPDLLYETAVSCLYRVAERWLDFVISTKFSTLCATLTYVSFLSTQVAHTTHTLSLSSHYSVVQILFPTRLFPSLYICGTVLIVLYVLSPPLCHLNVTLLISTLIGIMSCISSTLLFTCIPCFHANINIKKPPYYLYFLSLSQH